MDRSIILTLSKDDRLKPSKTFIGHEGEHLATTLLIKNEGFDNFFVHLKFENVDKVFFSEALGTDETKENYVFKVPQAVLKRGNIRCQLYFLDKETNETIYQSGVVTFTCGAQIETSNEEGIDETLGLIDERLRDLDEYRRIKDLIQFDGDGNSYLTNDGTYKPLDSSQVDYNKITNHPSINGNELIGNKLLSDLNIYIPKIAPNGVGTEVQYDENTHTYTINATLGFNAKVVDKLPTDAEGISLTTIYLVPNSESKKDNAYIEWVYAEKEEGTYDWERIGTTETDLSEYATNTKVNELIVGSEEDKTLNTKLTLNTNDTKEIYEAYEIDKLLSHEVNGHKIGTWLGKDLYEKIIVIDLRDKVLRNGDSFELNIRDSSLGWIEKQFMRDNTSFGSFGPTIFELTFQNLKTKWYFTLDTNLEYITARCDSTSTYLSSGDRQIYIVIRYLKEVNNG